jgi:hypothetical protein
MVKPLCAAIIIALDRAGQRDALVAPAAGK